VSGVVFGLGAFVLGVLGLGAPARAACPDGKGAAAVSAAAVEDDLTVVLSDGRRIRLAGLEVPFAGDGSVAGDGPVAGVARARLAGLVRGAAALSLVAAAEAPDRYGRLPAYLFADGAPVQAAMARAGFARVRWLPGEEACLADLIAAEGEARAAGLGLWTLPEYRVRDADDLSLREAAGLYGIVRGRVVSVNAGDSLVFVDFGRDYRSDFTVMVPRAVADRLAAEGRPAEGFAGRMVEVRGMIERNNGPAIRLNDPAEITTIADGG
jgi:endonuclease YncB( thermonuclease family)